MIPRKEIKKAIPHGYMQRVAEIAGVTKKTVSQYLAEKNNNNKVEEAIIIVLQELKEEREKRSEIFKNLL